MSGLVWITVFAACVAACSAGVIQQYSAPVAYAAPALKVGPAASSHASFTQHTGTVHAAPVAYAAPVAHYAAPVAHYAAPIAKVATYAAPIAKAVVAEAYAPPHYDFAYAVHDPHTGDVKEQKESRKDDVVHGMYSLIEADGSKRIVEYTADDHNGFQAVVHREPAAHPVAVKAVAAPIIKYAAPVAAVKYAAPVAAVKYAAPAATYVSYSAPTHVYHH